MKFLSVIILSLFISLKSSTASAQDGTFHENAKTNGEKSSVSGILSSLYFSAEGLILIVKL